MGIFLVFSVNSKSGDKEESVRSMKCANTVGEVSSTCSLGSPEEDSTAAASPLFLVTGGCGGGSVESPESSVDELRAEGE